MLDVHPPHAPTHTWRDFFIHIATIVIGLLIAIGLEQSVEWTHHKHQVTEAREALRSEREKNYKLFALEARTCDRHTPGIEKNLEILLYLRAHPHAPRESWPGVFVWHGMAIPFISSAWATAQRDGVIELLPQSEVERLDELYRRLDQVRANEIAERNLSEDAGGLYEREADLTKIDPRDLDKLIDLTTQLLVAHVRIGFEMRRLTQRFPDFPPAPDVKVLERLLAKDSNFDTAEYKAANDEYLSIAGGPESSTEAH